MTPDKLAEIRHYVVQAVWGEAVPTGTYTAHVTSLLAHINTVTAERNANAVAMAAAVKRAETLSSMLSDVKGQRDRLSKIAKDATDDRDAAVNRADRLAEESRAWREEYEASAARCNKLEAENADLRARAVLCATNAADLAGVLRSTIERHADVLTELMARVERLEEGALHDDDRGEPVKGEEAKGCEGCKHDSGVTCYALPGRKVAEWIDDARRSSRGFLVPSPGQGTCPGRVEASRG